MKESVPSQMKEKNWDGIMATMQEINHLKIYFLNGCCIQTGSVEQVEHNERRNQYLRGRARRSMIGMIMGEVFGRKCHHLVNNYNKHGSE